MIERAVVEAASHLRREGENYLIATVVAGSGYRTPGSHALITRDRWVAGSVSSGDLVKASVVERAWQRAAGDPVLIRDADRDEADDAMLVGLRLGCCGELDVLLERAQPNRLDPFAI